MTHIATDNTRPWWRFGHVWLVISGPAVVVLAGFFTLYLAITRGDPVLDERYLQTGPNAQVARAATPASLAPAIQGRNHAATGVLPQTGAR